MLVSGGINGGADTAAVKTPEIYTPDINWATRSYNAGRGHGRPSRNPPRSPATITPSPCFCPTAASSPPVPAWTGVPAIPPLRPTEHRDLLPGVLQQPGPTHTRQRSPLAQLHPDRVLPRPRLDGAGGVVPQSGARPLRVGYALSRLRPALRRLEFTHDRRGHPAGHLPERPSVVPPGHYMLWMVDKKACRASSRGSCGSPTRACTLITDRSTFSREEVEALGNGGGGDVRVTPCTSSSTGSSPPSSPAPRRSPSAGRTPTSGTVTADLPGSGPRLQETTPGLPIPPSGSPTRYTAVQQPGPVLGVHRHAQLIRVTFTHRRSDLHRDA